MAPHKNDDVLNPNTKWPLNFYLEHLGFREDFPLSEITAGEAIHCFYLLMQNLRIGYLQQKKNNRLDGKLMLFRAKTEISPCGIVRDVIEYSEGVIIDFNQFNSTIVELYIIIYNS